MSAQVRLEALKLAVQHSGNSAMASGTPRLDNTVVGIAATFEEYLKDGLPVASEPEMKEDATGKRRKKKRGRFSQ